MSFEQPTAPDRGRESVRANLLGYFEDELEGLETSYADEKDLTEISNIISALEENDFEPASIYLENELERIKERVIEVRKMSGTDPQFDGLLEKTQKLWDSLKLEEK